MTTVLCKTMRILRRRTLERRLFKWLLGLALVPALLVLGSAAWIGRGTLDWLGTLGPWAEVSTSGSALLDATRGAATTDPDLARAAEAHRAVLERSLVQAQRWSFLGRRFLSILPIGLLCFALLLAFAALLISRKLSRQLSRPIQELEAWTERIALAEPLPPPLPREKREVREVQALRQALRRAADDLATARTRALQQERTRAWGEMARRIAHEMKNPLTPLRLAAHRMRDSGNIDPALAEPLRVVDEEIARLEQLAREFSMLGRPADGPRSQVDVGELLHALVKSDVPSTIPVDFSAPAVMPLVSADFNALQQAFRNVLRNAMEAVDGREEPRIEVHLDAGGDDVHVMVRDNGRGFAADAEQLFQPDYTTKPRGTGLGLTIARQTIESHGGHIHPRTPDGGGAEFAIRLPIAQSPNRPLAPVSV